MVLSKQDVFSAEDCTYENITISEWGGDVRIKVMSIEEQIKFETLNREKKSDNELVFALLSQCCVDENGEHLFNDADIEELNKKSSTPVLKLFNACLKLNTMSKTALEDQAKNS